MNSGGGEAPLISVIVPVYRTEPYLKKCLDSVLAQTVRDIEVVVVDDGSPDGCPALCDEYAAKDVRVKVIHQSNGGRSAARNAGLAAATGRWIGFVDSDDWIEPDMYETLLATAEAQGAQVAVCGRVEEHDGVTEAIAYDAHGVLTAEQAIGELLRDVEVRSYLWDKLFQRELFEGIVFPQGRNYEDVAVVYRLFLRAKCIAFAIAVPYHYAFHGSNLVIDESLANRIDYWLAAKERFDVLAGRYPQYLQLLELDVMRTNLICWSLAWGAKGHDAGAFAEHKHAMAAFARKHWRCLLGEDLGKAGRLCARLTQYSKRWALAATRGANGVRRWLCG